VDVVAFYNKEETFYIDSNYNWFRKWT